MVENPFARGTAAIAAAGTIVKDLNEYYRKVVVNNLM